MAIIEKRICPLGSECKDVKDGKNGQKELHICAWLVTLAGQNPQGGPDINQEMCALASLPLLLVENARMTRSTAAATESLRNEVARGNDTVTETLLRMPARAPNLRLINSTDHPE